MNKYHSKFDMATVAKAVGEFSGEGKEDPQEWLESAEVTTSIAGYSEKELGELVFLALRGKAKSWGLAYMRGKSTVC